MNPQAAALYQQRLQAQQQSNPASSAPTSPPSTTPAGLSAFMRPNGQIPPQLLAQLAQIRPPAPQNPLMSQLMQAQALQVRGSQLSFTF